MTPSSGPASSPSASAPLRSDFADDPDMAELVEFFVGELQDRVSAMTSAFQSGDRLQLKTLTHQLKGAAGGYGFPSITALAAQVESVLKNEQAQVTSVGAQLDQLIALCRRASVK